MAVYRHRYCASKTLGQIYSRRFVGTKHPRISDFRSCGGDVDIRLCSHQTAAAAPFEDRNCTDPDRLSGLRARFRDPSSTAWLYIIEPGLMPCILPGPRQEGKKRKNQRSSAGDLGQGKIGRRVCT